MSGGYTKLFSDIVDSSIWEEDAPTCKVWVTLLALSDADGYIRGSVPWLAGKSKVTPEQCECAIRKFASPDPQSRTPDNEGRRIEILDNGWLILNYLAFRDRLSNDPIASATRERVKKHRERYKALRNAKSVTCEIPVYASVSVHASVPENSSLNSENGFDMTLFNDLKVRLSEMYKRTKPHLTCEEAQNLLEVSKRPEVLTEIADLEAYRTTTEFFPRSMSSLLRDWDKTLDQSRNQSKPIKQKTLIEKQLEQL